VGKVAFLFPGQGAQYIGMGQEIAERYPIAMEVFENANRSLGFDIKEMCFQGPQDELNKTENTQPAILVTSIAILRVLEELGINADVTAGLSLGEYSALVYTGAVEFDDAVKLVKKRGRFMQEAVPLGMGTMAAIMGLDRETVADVVKEAEVQGVVEGANYNCPGQIVISGEVPAVEIACGLAKERGAKKAIVLPVSAPFHCSLLEPAGTKLKVELNNIEVKSMKKDLIANVTGKFVTDETDIKSLLIDQVSKSVLWEDSIELMINNNVDTFIEVGPGKSLTSFTKKIAKNMGKEVNCFNVENIDSLNKLIDGIN